MIERRASATRIVAFWRVNVGSRPFTESASTSIVLRMRNRASAPARFELTGATMFVTVIHHIHDPEGFQAAEAKALEAGLPSHVGLPIHAATDDHTLGICIWEGESVDSVRDVVEGAVGAWSNNEYYEMQVDGLTPQLG